MIDKLAIKQGCIDAFPLAIAIGAYGLSFGMLAIQADFTVFQSVMMSVFVFSGTVQLASVAMIASGASLLSILTAATLLNLRNLLYGATLSKGLRNVKKKWRFLLAFGVSDESFVLGTQKFKRDGPAPVYFATVALFFYMSWIIATLFGALIGDQVDPLQFGLDLAFPVTFAALLAPSLKEKASITTAICALIIATSMEVTAPGNEFTIVVTGLVAPFAGVMLNKGGH
ncbi:AzlC family ABC transporter permease [Geomicrobium sp. JCM 19039]|uniref:AzlC family ABC transporter permease n=1 Tax=Geomicrobium sp. JCM 19039 TaxID=1460636 RepID=UPI00045F106E|nr:AzlC family ABC transporter permease [Geomicrobium sp. JCM 19039]GAK11764.1 branched-chain amino acid transport protein AzlC [Geomicrobium sp. JCM 19039]